jgi:hypothetical protein
MVAEEGPIPRGIGGMLTDPPRYYNYMGNQDPAPYGRDNPLISIPEGNPNKEGFNAIWHDILEPAGIGLGWGGDTWYVYDPWPGEGVYDFDELDNWIERLKGDRNREIGVKFSFVPRWLWSADPAAEEPSGAAGTFFIYLKRGHVLPPADYDKWEELIYQTVYHLNIEKGYNCYFEAWNEPNTKFWAGSQAQYLEMHARTVAAIRRADPNAQIGGPSSAGSNMNWPRALIQYCAENEVPLDYVAWHDYLYHAIQNGNVRSFTEQVQNIRNVLTQYPSLGEVDIHITEWSFMWMPVALPSATFNGAYTLQSMFEMLDSGVHTAYYTGVTGSPSFPDSATTALKMYNSLDPMRIEATISDPESTIRAIGSRNDSKATILVWNYPFDELRVESPKTPAGASGSVRQEYFNLRLQSLRDMVQEELAATPEQVEVNLRSIPPGNYVLDRYLLDSAHLGILLPHIESQNLIIEEDGAANLAFPLEAYGLTMITLESVPFIESWAGYPAVNAFSDIDTGAFLGLVNVRHGDWIFSYRFQSWLYLPETFVSSHGTWSYIFR